MVALLLDLVKIFFSVVFGTVENRMKIQVFQDCGGASFIQALYYNLTTYEKTLLQNSILHQVVLGSKNTANNQLPFRRGSQPQSMLFCINI